MELSLVVPSFKQATTICDDLHMVTQYARTLSSSCEIIVVVDGNIDNTVECITNDPELSHVTVLELSKNQGKGAALRYGLSHASGEIIGFIDAGGDIDPSCLTLMLDIMKFSDADIVIGSKRHPLSKVSYPFIRRIYSTGYQMLNHLLFRLNVKDTQVGLKLFRKDVLQNILPHVTIKRFAFDLELLVIASSLGYKRIIESPISITHKFNSTISTKVVLEMLQDTLGLYFKPKTKPSIPLSPGIEITRISNTAPISQPHLERIDI